MINQSLPVGRGNAVSHSPSANGPPWDGGAEQAEEPLNPGVGNNLCMGPHDKDDALCVRPIQAPFVSIHPVDVRIMSDPASRLREARAASGFDSASSAAKAMGVGVSTYVQHENGGRGIPASRALQYGRFFGVRPEWLLYGRGEKDAPQWAPQLTMLPVMARIQAGAWLAVDDFDQGQEQPMMSAALDPRYPHAPQYLREVQGDSMNARGIFPGDFAHIADFAESGANINTGMVVEVTRTRDGGALREITLKEAEVVPGGAVILWPRSTNPRWKDPVPLDPDDGSEVEVRVTGILLSVIRRF